MARGYGFMLKPKVDTPTPNFSIVVPGTCNGKCSFCNWLHMKTCDNYLEKLKEVLVGLPENFTQISLTGGEPTTSQLFSNILNLIKKHKTRWPKVVLTTNGETLVPAQLKGIINHINISRHHYNDWINQQIFRNPCALSGNTIAWMAEKSNNNGIDVTLNCVITPWTYNNLSCDEYIQFAKEVNATAVCFRKLHGSLEPSKLETSVCTTHPLVFESSCEVCRTAMCYIRGMPVYWRCSCDRPRGCTKEYEVVFHPNGVLSYDWSAKRPVKNDTEKKILAMLENIDERLSKLEGSTKSGPIKRKKKVVYYNPCQRSSSGGCNSSGCN